MPSFRNTSYLENLDLPFGQEKKIAFSILEAWVILGLHSPKIIQTMALSSQQPGIKLLNTKTSEDVGPMLT